MCFIRFTYTFRFVNTVPALTVSPGSLYPAVYSSHEFYFADNQSPALPFDPIRSLFHLSSVTIRQQALLRYVLRSHIEASPSRHLPYGLVFTMKLMICFLLSSPEWPAGSCFSPVQRSPQSTSLHILRTESAAENEPAWLFFSEN